MFTRYKKYQLYTFDVGAQQDLSPQKKLTLTWYIDHRRWSEKSPTDGTTYKNSDNHYCDNLFVKRSIPTACFAYMGIKLKTTHLLHLALVEELIALKSKIYIRADSTANLHM